MSVITNIECHIQHRMKIPTGRVQRGACVFWWRGCHQYKCKEFALRCCKDAFYVNADCDFAFCMKCYDTKEKEWEGGKKKKKNRRTSRVASTEVGTEERKGTCGVHTLEDLKNFEIELNYIMLARKRKPTKKGYNLIARRCQGYVREGVLSGITDSCFISF